MITASVESNVEGIITFVSDDGRRFRHRIPSTPASRKWLAETFTAGMLFGIDIDSPILEELVPVAEPVSAKAE